MGGHISSATGDDHVAVSFRLGSEGPAPIKQVAFISRSPASRATENAPPNHTEHIITPIALNISRVTLLSNNPHGCLIHASDLPLIYSK